MTPLNSRRLTLRLFATDAHQGIVTLEIEGTVKTNDHYRNIVCEAQHLFATLGAPPLAESVMEIRPDA